MKTDVSRLPRPRLASLSLAGLGVGVCLVASIVSPATIGIPQAHLTETFGFQSPVCWIVALSLMAAVLVTDARMALVSLLLGEAAIVVWYGWDWWLVRAPRFAELPYPFVGVDILGPSWYAAAVALPLAAADIVTKLRVWRSEVGVEAWLLAAVPGFGLARLGRWGRGLAWLLLVAAAIYLASLQSPDPTVWQDFGQFNVPTPPPTRAPVWIFLALAAGLVVLSLLDTLREWRRHRPEPIPTSSD